MLAYISDAVKLTATIERYIILAIDSYEIVTKDQNDKAAAKPATRNY